MFGSPSSQPTTPRLDCTSAWASARWDSSQTISGSMARETSCWRGSHEWDRRRPISLRLQLHLLERGGERVAGDEADARLFHARADPAEAGDQPDRREHHLVVDELLDAVQGGLAAFDVEVARLLAEEAVDVAVASGRVGAAAGHEGLDPRGRVAEGAAAALHE